MLASQHFVPCTHSHTHHYAHIHTLSIYTHTLSIHTDTHTMLHTHRKLQLAIPRCKDGNYTVSGLQGWELASRNFGIVGTGAIGAVMARLCLVRCVQCIVERVVCTLCVYPPCTPPHRVFKSTRERNPRCMPMTSFHALTSLKQAWSMLT